MPSQSVEFAGNGANTEGYLSIPAEGSGAGLIVIQEWWGLVPHIKDVCDRLAREGFVALAPDLYHGAEAKSPDEAGKLMMALNIEQAEKDLRGAVKFLLDHEAVTSEKVGTVGFCMGGVLSLFAACKNPEQVGACVVFYGVHPKVNPPLDDLQAPVLGHYAERDTSAPPEKARELEALLNELGKENQIHIYADTDHAFFNDTRPEVYNEDAAQVAWQRTLEFFNKQL